MRNLKTIRCPLPSDLPTKIQPENLHFRGWNFGEWLNLVQGSYQRWQKYTFLWLIMTFSFNFKFSLIVIECNGCGLNLILVWFKSSVLLLLLDIQLTWLSLNIKNVLSNQIWWLFLFAASFYSWPYLCFSNWREALPYFGISQWYVFIVGCGVLK